MPRPVIFTVDDDPTVLNAVERDLRQRYGQDYRILSLNSARGALEALRQLGVFDPLPDQLRRYGPVSEVYNWRKLEVGQARPCFVLSR